MKLRWELSRAAITGLLPRPNLFKVANILIFATSLIIGCGGAVETPPAPGPARKRVSTMLTSDEALAIARQAVAGKVELQKGAPVTINRQDDKYVVTFVHINAPGVRGADYDARLTIDAKTGKVVEFLAGS